MSVAPSRRVANDWHYHPLRHRLTVTQIQEVQVVRCEATAASSSTVDNHLKAIDGAAAVCGTRRRGDSRAFELLPFVLHHAKGVCIAGDDILSSVASCSSEQNYFRLGDLGDSVTESSERNLAESVDLLNFLAVRILIGGSRYARSCGCRLSSE